MRRPQTERVWFAHAVWNPSRCYRAGPVGSQVGEGAVMSSTEVWSLRFCKLRRIRNCKAEKRGVKWTRHLVAGWEMTPVSERECLRIKSRPTLNFSYLRPKFKSRQLSRSQLTIVDTLVEQAALQLVHEIRRETDIACREYISGAADYLTRSFSWTLAEYREVCSGDSNHWTEITK